ncbi:HEAT repeat-containing protein, partial [Toxoplasma gondii p89]
MSVYVCIEGTELERTSDVEADMDGSPFEVWGVLHLSPLSFCFSFSLSVVFRSRGIETLSQLISLILEGWSFLPSSSPHALSLLLHPRFLSKLVASCLSDSHSVVRQAILTFLRRLLPLLLSQVRTRPRLGAWISNFFFASLEAEARVLDSSCHSNDLQEKPAFFRDPLVIHLLSLLFPSSASSPFASSPFASSPFASSPSALSLRLGAALLFFFPLPEVAARCTDSSLLVRRQAVSTVHAWVCCLFRFFSALAVASRRCEELRGRETQQRLAERGLNEDADALPHSRASPARCTYTPEVRLPLTQNGEAGGEAASRDSGHSLDTRSSFKFPLSSHNEVTGDQHRASGSSSSSSSSSFPSTFSPSASSLGCGDKALVREARRVFDACRSELSRFWRQSVLAQVAGDEEETVRERAAEAAACLLLSSPSPAEVEELYGGEQRKRRRSSCDEGTRAEVKKRTKSTAKDPAADDEAASPCSASSLAKKAASNEHRSDPGEKLTDRNDTDTAASDGKERENSEEERGPREEREETNGEGEETRRGRGREKNACLQTEGGEQILTVFDEEIGNELSPWLVAQQMLKDPSEEELEDILNFYSIYLRKHGAFPRSFMSSCLDSARKATGRNSLPPPSVLLALQAVLLRRAECAAVSSSSLFPSFSSPRVSSPSEENGRVSGSFDTSQRTKVVCDSRACAQAVLSLWLRIYGESGQRQTQAAERNGRDGGATGALWREEKGEEDEGETGKEAFERVARRLFLVLEAAVPHLEEEAKAHAGARLCQMLYNLELPVSLVPAAVSACVSLRPSLSLLRDLKEKGALTRSPEAQGRNSAEAEETANHDGDASSAGATAVVSELRLEPQKNRQESQTRPHFSRCRERKILLRSPEREASPEKLLWIDVVLSRVHGLLSRRLVPALRPSVATVGACSTPDVLNGEKDAVTAEKTSASSPAGESGSSATPRQIETALAPAVTSACNPTEKELDLVGRCIVTAGELSLLRDVSTSSLPVLLQV